MDLNLPEKRVFVGPATLWKRILAFVLDILLLDFFVLSIFNTVAEKMLGGSGDFLIAYKMFQQDSAQLQAITMLFMLIVFLVMSYFVLLQYATGQTIGCMLLNVHVVSQVGDKEFIRPGFWSCVMRNLFLIPAIPFILLWVADPLYLFFAKKGQRLTEWLSNSRVVEQFTI